MKACRYGHEFKQSGCPSCRTTFRETGVRAPEPTPNIFLGWLGAPAAIFAIAWVIMALATWTW